jgi:hypothetical protein
VKTKIFLSASISNLQISTQCGKSMCKISKCRRVADFRIFAQLQLFFFGIIFGKYPFNHYKKTALVKNKAKHNTGKSFLATFE